jgi:hypothetical protein
MLQYLLNTTAIWLVSLVVFDLFLRNEAQHTYNRLYLLAILCAGALIPLWVWEYDSVIYSAEISTPLVEQTSAIKENIVVNSEKTIIGWEQWVQRIYISGLIIALILFIKDIFTIVRLFRKGVRSKDGTWTIIETDQQISPFSAFRYVFISNRKKYSDEELKMILEHEEQHGHLLHFIDVLLTRIFTIIFWFNPMVYLIEKRLLIVHEYQADAAITNDANTYGMFLVEQSILSTAPSLSHSFIRSPLSKRIIMLKKRTTKVSHSKQLLILPVLIFSLLFFSENAFSTGTPNREGNKVTYNGNVIEFEGESKIDTNSVTVQDPNTGETLMLVSERKPLPVKINGETIYNTNTIRTPGKYGGDVSTESNFTSQGLKMYLLLNMGKELRKLGDGSYTMSLDNIIIDKKGAIVFFEVGNIEKRTKVGTEVKHAPIDKKMHEQIARKISQLITKMPLHKPADINGKPVYNYKGSMWGEFVIKDKKLQSL